MNYTDKTLAGLDVMQEQRDYQRILKALQKKKYSQALLLLTPLQSQRIYKKKTEGNSGRLTMHFITIQSAWCQFEKNQIAEAKTLLNNGLREEPLDGPMNLFLAYIHLIEDNKPAAIHRYTVLYDNPFYQKRVEEILEKIRYSDSIAELLNAQPRNYFYEHDLPSMWSRFKLSTLLELLIKITSLVRHKRFKKENTSIQNKFRLLEGKKLKIFFLIFVLTASSISIVLWWQGNLEIDKLSNVSSKNSTEELFNPQSWLDFSEDEVKNWLDQYQLLKQAINLRQFNEAIRIYNTISSSDIPIEVKNKFFILYRFVVTPQFEDLASISSFIDVHLKKNKGFFYKFNFRVLQSQNDTVRFLIELPRDSNESTTVKNSLGLYLYRAILSIDDSATNFDFFKSKTQYEAIAKLHDLDRNYLHFKVLVARETVGANE